MKFVSLASLDGEAVSFQEALARGIAPDGGLYVPKSIPHLSEAEIGRLVGADRYTAAKIMLTPWLEEEIPPADLEAIIQQASTFDTPLVEVGNKKVLELFHGPTLAFKDVAAGYLAAFLSYFNKKSGHTSTVLVATSGDTGGAIAHGFAGVAGINLVILYPKNRISRLQREQLRRVAANVHSLEVNGDFNDCQELVKQAFASRRLNQKLHVTSANSINIGRLLPQITYYANLYAQLGTTKARVVVPTGNLGNLSAGILARAMGLPLGTFVAANNMNDSLSRYLKTGHHNPLSTIQTMSNAMDVNSPNNLPRFIRFFGDNIAAARAAVQAMRVTDQETAQTIKQVYESTGYLLDPHTAVGWHASEMLEGHDDTTDIILATASPLKFAEEIFEKTGIKVDNSQLLEDLRRQPERYSRIENSLDQLLEYIESALPA